jgi:hypothetical protein
MPDEASDSLENRLKKSTAELLELEQALISGDMDARVLRDFRDAVDYVRKAAWAVAEWQARHAKSRDTSTVLPLLMFERIRRATQLCNALAIDMQSGIVTSDSQGTGELSEAVDNLRSLLAIQKTEPAF